VLSPSFFISLFFWLFPLTFWGANNAKKTLAGRLAGFGGRAERAGDILVFLCSCQ
jgi:hypothetical protein